jgi:hypothetical protein
VFHGEIPEPGSVLPIIVTALFSTTSLLVSTFHVVALLVHLFIPGVIHLKQDV